MTIFPVHGFLQQAGDWREIPWPSGVAIEATDLWRDLSEISFGENAFKAWARNFCNRVEKIPGPRVLIGYSLGGRLAMHAMKEAPELFSACILVSANPGLKTKEEREQRLKRDLLWAERFQKTPWIQLLSEWDAQPVFQSVFQTGHGATPTRLESSFSRVSLVRALDQWSLGRQADLRSDLASVASAEGASILLFSGEEDSKFRAIADEVAGLNPRIEHQIIEKAGHRVPWDQPRAFAGVVADFLKNREGR